MAYNLKHFYLSRPPSVERSPIRPPTLQADELKAQRNRSLGPYTNKGILSEKVPITFNPSGIKLHPYPSATLEVEDKVHLYSEVERLSILNYELKRHNETLSLDLEQSKVSAARVPELEAIIHELQSEVAYKNESMHQAVREQECLKIDNINLSRLEPAYNELLDHNKALIAEIDGLDRRLTDLLAERDVLEAHGESVKILKPRLEDATRRIEMMDRDLSIKDQEILDVRTKMQDLHTRFNAIQLDNEQLQELSLEHERERDLLRQRIEDLERIHEERIHDLKTQMDAAKKVHVEYERAEVTAKFTTQLDIKDDELAQARKYIENLEKRLMIANKEADHLQEWNINKAGDIDSLTMRIAQLEVEREELRKVVEIEAYLKTEKQLAQQKTEYETTLLQLRQEINDLEKLKVVLKQKENEVQILKSLSANNEKCWEVKLHQTVENEVKNASNKFLLEKSMVEGELSTTKDQISSLENQISYLTMEVERLTNVQNQKNSEINELQRKLMKEEMNYRLASDEQKTKLEIEKKQSLEEQRRDLEKIHQGKVDEMRKFQTILEEKTYALLDENKKLTTLAEERLKELESVSLKLKVTGDLHKQELEETLKKSQVLQRMNTDKEVANISVKHRGEKEELETRLSVSMTELERLKAQCQAQDNQIDWLSKSARDKDLELQQEKRRYVELEIQKNRDINEVREQFDAYKKATIESTTLQVRFEAEKAALVSQISGYKEKINEMEKRLLLFISENEKMRDLYNDKSNELEVLKHKYRVLEESWYDEKASLENENENLKRSNLDIKEMSIRFASDKSQYENQLKQLKMINENGKQELEKLYELMNQRKKEQDYYLKQNEDLKKEIDRLTRLVREADLESSAKKDRYAGMERTITELERDRDLYKQHADRLNTQLQQTYAELQEKIMELDIAKKKYDDSVMKLSSQLDKDLMNKMNGSSLPGAGKIGMINTTPGKSNRTNMSRSEF